MVETKIHSKALCILRNSYFDSQAVFEANRFSGGIWTFWNSSHLNIKVGAINDQIIVLLIMKEHQVEWMFTPIYLSPDVAIRIGL